MSDKRVKVTEALRKRILTLHKEGEGVSDIREKLLLEDGASLSDPTIRKIINHQEKRR